MRFNHLFRISTERLFVRQVLRRILWDLSVEFTGNSWTNSIIFYNVCVAFVFSKVFASFPLSIYSNGHRGGFLRFFTVFLVPIIIDYVRCSPLCRFVGRSFEKWRQTQRNRKVDDEFSVWNRVTGSISRTTQGSPRGVSFTEFFWRKRKDEKTTTMAVQWRRSFKRYLRRESRRDELKWRVFITYGNVLRELSGGLKILNFSTASNLDRPKRRRRWRYAVGSVHLSRVSDNFSKSPQPLSPTSCRGLSEVASQTVFENSICLC